MPITLAPVSRRRFLAGTIAAGIGLLLPGELFAADSMANPHRLALLSDIHIDADPARRVRDVTMYDHLHQVCDELLKIDLPPAAVFINGDCACNTGQVEDYRTLLKLLQPLRRHGLPLHLGMGNHDQREHLWQTIPHSESRVESLPDRQVLVAEFPRANVFMLDSLERTDYTPGLLGKTQIHWLAEALDARAKKPAIVMVHHQPDRQPKPSGLEDTEALFDVLLPRRQVKALVYGHTHRWEIARHEDLHCINLPAVAYVFAAGQPSGWVDARLRDNGMTLELRCIDSTHPKNGQTVDLPWRE